MNELALLERKTRLWHIEQAVNNILEFTAGHTLEQYLSDRMHRSAVERELMIIGEAMTRAEKVDPDLATLITDVPGIIATRNQLVHNYPRIAHERIWQIVTDHLPTLLSEVRTLLAAGENPA